MKRKHSGRVDDLELAWETFDPRSSGRKPDGRCDGCGHRLWRLKDGSDNCLSCGHGGGLE